jgi:lysophospholipase L1-like esterase
MPTAARTPTVREPGIRTWMRFSLLIVSLLLICLNRYLIPSIQFDWLNMIPLFAAIYVGYSLVRLDKTCGHLPYVRRCLSQNVSSSKPRLSFLFSPWIRSCLVLGVAIGALEFGLRCASYHRSLVYERQGNLLFTPVPNQAYVEKISLTPSRMNEFGLRGGAVNTSSGKDVILCLGDSITYGYGVDDAHTYPALLQLALDSRFPRRYTVLNAGVDAYPMAFEDQKFLYLCNRGLHPNVAIVGYSMNEGWLGQLVDSNEEIKRQFAQRVLLKNYLRSFALYNLVVENWARSYYDRMKGHLVPGSNFAVLSKEELDKRYETHLQRVLSDLRSHEVKPVFLLFCSFDGQTHRYDTQGPLQRKFADFAQKNGVPVFRSDDILRQAGPENADLARYFIDGCHMNELGTQRLAAGLAELLANESAAWPRHAR